MPVSVSDRAVERTLLQILLEMKQQTAILKRIDANVQSLWNQVDDTPVGFKINEHKL